MPLFLSRFQSSLEKSRSRHVCPQHLNKFNFSLFFTWSDYHEIQQQRRNRQNCSLIWTPRHSFGRLPLILMGCKHIWEHTKTKNLILPCFIPMNIIVEANIKWSPHVRIQINKWGAFRKFRCLCSINICQQTWNSVEHKISKYYW